MTSLSQANLVKLADERAAKGNLAAAVEYLEEALRTNRSSDLVCKLGYLYLKNKQEYQAYKLVKEEPDLFSEPQIYHLYCATLQANHFVIEALELEHLRQEKVPIQVEPVALQQQQKIMRDFQKLKQVNQQGYQSLLKLALPNFKSFAQSLLLDPSQNFAVRLSLCEDLIKLGIDEKLQVWVIGKQESFIPAKTQLLEKSTVYREVIAAIGSKYYHQPSQLPLALSAANLILGSLYPKLVKYVDEPDSFASDLTSFIETHQGRGHQKLFEAVYANLPQ